jgi:hypothetical protein
MLADAAARRAAIAPKLGDANKCRAVNRFRDSIQRNYSSCRLHQRVYHAGRMSMRRIQWERKSRPASGEADLAATVLLLGVRGTLAVGVCGGLLSRIAAAMRLGGFLQSGGVLALAV